MGDNQTQPRSLPPILKLSTLPGEKKRNATAGHAVSSPTSVTSSPFSSYACIAPPLEGTVSGRGSDQLAIEESINDQNAPDVNDFIQNRLANSFPMNHSEALSCTDHALAETECNNFSPSITIPEQVPHLIEVDGASSVKRTILPMDPSDVTQMPKTLMIANDSDPSQIAPNTALPSCTVSSSPMLHVCITLERSEATNSWGLVFIKENSGLAFIVHVVRPTEDGPTVAWCQILNSATKPSSIQYYEEKRLEDAGLLVPCLSPGDAIISINGIPLSVFPNSGEFASYIRDHCRRKMSVVALRHEIVWTAAQAEISRSMRHDQLVDTQAMTDRVSKAVCKMWRRVLAPVTTVTGCGHVKRQKIASIKRVSRNGDENLIHFCDDRIPVDDTSSTVLHNFWLANGYESFNDWHSSSKARWARSYSWHKERDEDSTVCHDFWLMNGYISFYDWHSTSKARWSRSYSWHKERRCAFQSTCEKEVHLPSVASTHTMIEEFENWLGVRKNQWRLERRKRKRQRVSLEDSETSPVAANDIYIDDMLEDLERLKTAGGASQPMDIMWIFDFQLGAPDDVVANLMSFLSPYDHGNLLCLSYTSNSLFKQRDDMWRYLFPSHWVVPRRPRQSWCSMYITKIRSEAEASRKRSDDVLVQAHAIIEKGDQLNKFEKLIQKAETDFEFSVNYVSGVVLERNSMLNLAVIDRRSKISRWLIEEKGADIESCDRGQFTPLMNAAWNGDKYMTRYLLSKGSDRTKLGYNHSSQGLAPPKFEGMTAEGWARKRGHDEVAELILLGLN
ncbi:hypothetical protein ACHAXA_001681 [Cyclostephanos tholiformis]|uniref:Uncharacterized protein n=1 Tax=Cyclostephanos tholiformis TaxID=382380 RepID=A0ABD3RS65_9STRA